MQLKCVLITVYSAVRTQQVLDQLWVRHQWFRVCIDGVSAVMNLPQCFKVAQQYITQPLGIHTWDFPLLGLLIFKPTRPKERAARLYYEHCSCCSIGQYSWVVDNIQILT